MNNRKFEIIIGVFLILMGAYFMVVGLKILEDDNVLVELWVMFFVGFLFFIVGIVCSIGKKLPQQSFMASIMLLCFSMIGFGIGFFGETSNLQKWVFGSSSFFCFLLSIFALTNKTKK